jgi:hypothetical protein
VYADWLEEQGDPRGEFIRLQCERLQIKEPARKRAMAEREDELARLHDADWMKWLPALEHVKWGEYRRGFVVSVLVEGIGPFLEYADVIFASAPIRRLHFRNLGAEGAAQLADSPHLQRITHLGLDNNQLGDEGVQALAESKFAMNLTWLALDGNQIRPAGAQALAKSRFLSELTVLMLSANQISDECATALATSKRLKKLAEIYLHANNLSETAIETLRRRWGKRLFV